MPWSRGERLDLVDVEEGALGRRWSGAVAGGRPERDARVLAARVDVRTLEQPPREVVVSDDEEGAASEAAVAIEAATRSGRRRPVDLRVSPRRARVHGTGTRGRAHATVAMVARTRSEDCAAEGHYNWIKSAQGKTCQKTCQKTCRPPPLQARIRRRTRQNGFSDERIRRQVGGSRGRGLPRPPIPWAFPARSPT